MVLSRPAGPPSTCRGRCHGRASSPPPPGLPQVRCARNSSTWPGRSRRSPVRHLRSGGEAASHRRVAPRGASALAPPVGGPLRANARASEPGVAFVLRDVGGPLTQARELPDLSCAGFPSRHSGKPFPLSRSLSATTTSPRWKPDLAAELDSP